jgi:hypothetical protein
MRVTLADDLVRYFCVKPPSNAASLHDLRAAAAMRFQVLYGESPAGWQLEGDWQAGRSFIACAVPAPLTAAIHAALHEKHLRAVAIVPRFIASWNRHRDALKPGAWLGVLHEGCTSIGVVAGDNLLAVRVLPDIGHETSLVELQTRLGREALLFGVPTPSAFHVCGVMPREWESAQGTTFQSIPLGPSPGSTRLAPPGHELARAAM